ncbi:MAG: signal peptidase II [Candidatus Neomarinimicrobiota bacterium]
MRVLYLSIILVILDQITKVLTRARMDLHESIPVVRNFFHFTHVTNDGMAFGLNFPAGIYVFTAVSVIAAVGLAWYLWAVRREALLLRTGLACIFAGAIGNLIDRVLFGQVTDFLDFIFWGHHFPVFNIADSSVTIGMVLFLYFSIIIQPRLEAAQTVS